MSTAMVQETAALQAELSMWQNAVATAIAAGQSYAIDGRTLQRVDVKVATDRIDFLMRRLSQRVSRTFVKAVAVPR